MIPKEKIPNAVSVEVVRKIEQERNGTVAEADRQSVSCAADSDMANTLLRKLTSGIKLVNDRFKDILAPQNEAIRQIRELKSQILVPLENSKRDLSIRLMEWREQERLRIAEAQRKVDEENRRLEEERLAEAERRRKIQVSHAAKGHETKPLAEVPEPEIIPDTVPLEATDTTKVQKQWTFKVTDENLIPRKYLVVKESLIRQAIFADRDENGVPQIEIPGINIFQREVGVYA